MNLNQILKVLQSQEVFLTLINLDFNDISIERALGVLWNPGSDALQIKVTAKDVPLTSKGILSYTSSIFDPVGISGTETDNSKSLERKNWLGQWNTNRFKAYIFVMKGKITILGCDPNSTMVWIKQ